MISSHDRVEGRSRGPLINGQLAKFAGLASHPQVQAPDHRAGSFSHLDLPSGSCFSKLPFVALIYRFLAGFFLFLLCPFWDMLVELEKRLVVNAAVETEDTVLFFWTAFFTLNAGGCWALFL